VRNRSLTALAFWFCMLPLSAQEKKASGVKSVQASFEPAEAVPGQVITFKLTITLDDGYHTYPLVQTDKQALGMVNKIEFPAPAAVVFVGDAIDPANPLVKAEPVLGIEQMLYYTGTVVYERKAVVSPKAVPGSTNVQLPKFTLSVCDKDSCFPPKKHTPEATLKVLDGPAIEIDKKYADEVKTALKDK
jgi:hypothetical protein